MMRMKKRKTAVFACVIVLFFCAILLGLCWGSYEISVHEVIATLLGNGTKIQNTAIFGIRLPRILLGIFVAAGLAISGGVLQTMTRNELADPGIIGINAGGATAAVLFIQFQTNAYFSELGTYGNFRGTCSGILHLFSLQQERVKTKTSAFDRNWDQCRTKCVYHFFYVQGRSWGLQPGNDLDVRLTLGGRMGIRQSFGTRDFTWRGIYFL